MAGKAHQQGVAVGGCFGDCICGNVAARPGAVFDHHLTPQQPAHLGGERTRQSIGTAASRGPHQNSNRPGVARTQGLRLRPAGQPGRSGPCGNTDQSLAARVLRLAVWPDLIHYGLSACHGGVVKIFAQLIVSHFLGNAGQPQRGPARMAQPRVAAARCRYCLA